MNNVENESHLLSLPTEIFTEIIRHVHGSLGSQASEQLFIQLRLVCRAFDDVVSREVFPRDRKNQFVRRNNIDVSTAKWLLLTKAKIYYNETKGALSYLHQCAAFATTHQSEWSRGTAYSYLDYLDAACHAVVANHGVHGVVRQVVFAAKRGRNPLAKGIRMLRARKSTLRASMTPVDINGALHMAAIMGNTRAVETMVSRGANPDLNHPVFGCALFVAAARGCYKTVSQLVNLGADLNVRGHLLATSLSGVPERNNTPLLVAAERSHREVVNLLAREPRVSINESGGASRRTVLMWAAERGWADTVRILLARGDVDVDAREPRGEFPIYSAVRQDHREVLVLLLGASKARLDAGPSSFCPVMFALLKGDHHMVRLLLDMGKIDPNKTLPYGADNSDANSAPGMRGSTEGTPLLIAVKNGHTDLVDVLLSHPGVNPNLAVGSCTPLETAIAQDREEVVKVFLRHQDRIEPSLLVLGKSLLHVAAARGAASVMKMLINHYGVDPNEYDDEGQTVLCSAIRNYQWKVVEYLVQCSAVNVNLPGHARSGPNVPLQMAAHQQNYIALGYLMKREDLDLNWSGIYGTALSIAVETSNQWAMKTLLYDNGVDVNRTSESFKGTVYVHRKLPPGSKSSWGFFGTDGIYGQDSPLLRAVKCDKLDAVQALLENHNVDPNVADTCGRTPLWWASRGGALRMARCILSSRIKPDVNAQDMEGWTPLLCATNNNKDIMTRLLLDVPEIDPNIPNQFGWTPLHICANHGNMRIFQQLMDHPKINVWARTNDGRTAVEVTERYSRNADPSSHMGRLNKLLGISPDPVMAFDEADSSSHL